MGENERIAHRSAGRPGRRHCVPGAGTRRLLLLACVCLLAALGACREEETSQEPAAPEARAGVFEAQVRGALQHTLRGAATARLDTAGRLAGLELEDADDTTRAGLSFELQARPLKARRIYTVRPRPSGREDTSFALMNVYLRLRGYAFAARAGSLRISRDSTGLHGAFDVRLRGLMEADSDEPATVSAHGQFEDVRPSRPRP